jgi:hypothetical protein
VAADQLNIIAHDPTDVLGRRIAAFVIDYGIAVILFAVLVLGQATTQDFVSVDRATSFCDGINDGTEHICIPVNSSAYVYTEGDLLLATLLPLGYLFLNAALLTGVAGWSIGKGVVGLRVVRQEDGRLCGVGRALSRWVMWIADGQPCGAPLVGFIVGTVSKGHRRVGDMVARTLVVDRRDVGVTPVVPGLHTNAYGGYLPYGAPPVPPWGAPPPGAPGGWGMPPSPPPPGQPMPPPSSPPPAQPGPWGAPPMPSPPQQQPVAHHARPGVDSPLWDDDRDTYIQWDPDISAWVQWDERAHEWRPIV